ncbi:MAG TPA: SAV_6107 family HEPN domain-containing protein [Pseudonocardiaceae bacterium]|nr:SAV_6107 family HEPN domain-containing protein [Pseudonocardiaceae bacterium]
MDSAVGRGKRAAAELRRLPHGGVASSHPSRLPTQEADVAAVAALTPSVVPRYDSPKYDRLSHCPPSVRILLKQARQGLLDAEYAARPVDRYAQAHLAALRAAAAVLAARARPRNRAQPASAWALLATVAPELAEWSTFFAATSATRAAAEAGVHRLVTERNADDLVRQAGEFLTLARDAVARTSR